MSFKLLAHDLESILERLQEGTDFPYGEGDEALISQVNQTAKGLRLPEPIDAAITQSSVYLAVRRWGTGETVADAYRAQSIAMLIDGEPFFAHSNALDGSGDRLLAPLRDWLRQARREQIVQHVKDESPVFPEPTTPLTRMETAVRKILMEEAQGRASGWAVSGGTIIMKLQKVMGKPVAPSTVCRTVSRLTDKGCPCDSSKAGYWLLPNPSRLAG